MSKFSFKWPADHGVHTFFMFSLIYIIAETIRPHIHTSELDNLIIE